MATCSFAALEGKVPQQPLLSRRTKYRGFCYPSQKGGAPLKVNVGQKAPASLARLHSLKRMLSRTPRGGDSSVRSANPQAKKYPKRGVFFCWIFSLLVRTSSNLIFEGTAGFRGDLPLQRPSDLLGPLSPSFRWGPSHSEAARKRTCLEKEALGVGREATITARREDYLESRPLFSDLIGSLVSSEDHDLSKKKRGWSKIALSGKKDDTEASVNRSGKVRKRRVSS